ncbi:MAG TPA: hypothetical protein VF861_00350 [Telluria sp.]
MAVLLSALAAPKPGSADPLPAPSRTMYKCMDGKKLTYTDQPCLGAQRLDVVPSRGLNKLSGTERTGADVANERRRENFAAAIQPLTGMQPQQFGVAVRRQNLGNANRSECYSLDPAIAAAESRERSADRTTLLAVQQQLFLLRKRYVELRC